MNSPNPGKNVPKLPSWPINLGIGLATGIILSMLVASWGLRQENWQKAGVPTIAAVMFVAAFLITVLATTAAAFVRNGFRCTRRAIVIAISILVLALLSLNIFLAPTRAQRAAIAKLTATGAKIYYDDRQRSGLAMLFGDQYFCDVTGVAWDYHGAPNPDIDIGCLRTFSSLQSLALAGIKAPPTDLEPLKSLPSLRDLSMRECELSDESWETIGNISSLSSLELYNNSQISSPGLKYLANPPRLTFLLLANDRTITDEEFAALGDISSLTYLVLWCPDIADQRLMHLSRLTKLRQLELLDLQNSQVSDKTVQELQKTLPNCTIRKK